MSKLIRKHEHYARKIDPRGYDDLVPRGSKFFASLLVLIVVLLVLIYIYNLFVWMYFGAPELPPVVANAIESIFKSFWVQAPK